MAETPNNFLRSTKEAGVTFINMVHVLDDDEVKELANWLRADGYWHLATAIEKEFIENSPYKIKMDNE